MPMMDIRSYMMDGSTTEVDPVKLTVACGYSEDCTYFNEKPQHLPFFFPPPFVHPFICPFTSWNTISLSPFNAAYLAFLITAHTKTGERKYSIPLEMFKAFATREGISTINALKALLQKWDSEIRNGTNSDLSVALFKEIFIAGKACDESPNIKELEKGTAINLIKLVPTKWKHFDDYIRFLEGPVCPPMLTHRPFLTLHCNTGP